MPCKYLAAPKASPPPSHGRVTFSTAPLMKWNVWNICAGVGGARSEAARLAEEASFTHPRPPHPLTFCHGRELALSPKQSRMINVRGGGRQHGARREVTSLETAPEWEYSGDDSPPKRGHQPVDMLVGVTIEVFVAWCARRHFFFFSPVRLKREWNLRGENWFGDASTIAAVIVVII